MSFPFKLIVASQLSLTSQFRTLLVRLEVKLNCHLPNAMALVSLLLCSDPECSTVPVIHTHRSACPCTINHAMYT